MACFFSVLGVLPLIKGRGFVNITFLLIAVPFLVSAFLFPQILKPLNYIWFKFGLLLQKIVSPIMLGVIYFCVFTPVGIFMKLFAYDPLKRQFDPKAKTYWVEKDGSRNAGQGMADQF